LLKRYAQASSQHFPNSCSLRRAIAVLNDYVRARFNRVKLVEALFQEAIVPRVAAGKRQRQYGNNQAKFESVTEK